MIETISILATETTPGVAGLALHWAYLVGKEVGGEKVALIHAGSSATPDRRVRHSAPAMPILLFAEDPEQLSVALAACREKRLRWTFVLAPAGDPTLSTEAARLADLVVLPCPPTLEGLQEVGETVALAESAGAPASLLLVDCAPDASLDGHAFRILQAVYSPPVCPHLVHRPREGDADVPGRLNLSDTAAAWRWLRSRLN